MPLGTVAPVHTGDTHESAPVRVAMDAVGARHPGAGGDQARGRDDPRLSLTLRSPAVANTATQPVIYGPGTDATVPKTPVSAAFGDGLGTDIAGKGRDPDLAFGIETRGQGASPLSFQSGGALPRSEMPQMIAMQIAAAAQKAAPGARPVVELMLSPEELGPVRLTFTQTEPGVTVNVLADRAETLDLLRRNIDTLAQEFLDIGYESAQFTFDQGDADARNAPPPVDMEDADAGSRTAKDTPDPITPLVLVADRLDIRL